MTRTKPDEVLQRVRRIETRLTQTMLVLGINTSAQKPEFDADNGTITLPSPHTSMREILENIPTTWDGPVGVFVGDRQVVTLYRCE